MPRALFPQAPIHPPRVSLRVAIVGLACYLMHQLLAIQYANSCRGWLSALAIEPSPACSLLRKGMVALQWAPVAAAYA
jgi:hypothetical protein